MDSCHQSEFGWAQQDVTNLNAPWAGGGEEGEEGSRALLAYFLCCRSHHRSRGSPPPWCMGGFADFFDDSDDELVANVIEVPAEPPPPAPQPVPPPQPPPAALAPPPAAAKSLHEILRIAGEKERERERARERKSEVAPSANRKGKRPVPPALPAAALPAAAPAATAPVAAGASKRSRVSAGDGTLVIRDDSALPEADAAEWRNRVGELTRAGEQWVDESFPACQLSIRGKEEEAAPPPRVPAPLVPGVPPTCQCHVPAAAAKVTKDTPNKDREYWHCKARKCGFFCWADGGDAAFKRGGTAAKLSWARLPLKLNVVSDFGFRAEDLRQGGVGDCWFMSALAVVAQRHDLIAKLFACDTARNAAGCYCLRLFLDGQWTSVWLDDLLPMTDAPRRSALAFETRLAFCRCGSATGEQQLWASLVEKAYSKAHGSYQSISGGWVAEALLDLTGAPTEMVDMADDAFESEAMWARLKAYAALGLPMGCGTNNAEGSNLREVGLVGGHAYSILDVREAATRGGEAVRLLRIRNPHACGEWTGDWSDQSDMWAQLVDQGGGGGGGGGGGFGGGSSTELPLCPYGAGCYRQSAQHRAEFRHDGGSGSQGQRGFERTGVDDGTFWIDYTKFLMGFSHIDVRCTLQPHAPQGCNPTPSGLQPHALQAATPCVSGL